MLHDATVETGLEFLHDNGMSGELYFAEIMGSGLALLDYDQDGDLDLYLVQGASFDGTVSPPLTQEGGCVACDRLLRADWDQDGLRWVDVTQSSEIRAIGYGMGVAAGDFDGDGWTDLYVTNLGANQLWRNRGDGTFADVTDPARVGDARWAVSASFADYDRDGGLDLYVGNYVDFRLATHKACASTTGLEDYCGPLAYAPEADLLYRNLGDGSFEEVSRRLGIDRRPGGALGVVAVDADEDGRVDFYVANDQVPNKLWRNTEDGFVDDAALSGVAVNESGQPEASMGVVVADLTGDGSEDLLLTHLSRETHTLYARTGDGFFEDRTRVSGLAAASFGATGFGVAAGDFNRDGLLDLFVANGAVKRLEDQVRRGDAHPLRQANQLFVGTADGRFEEFSDPALVAAEVTRGVAAGDVDNDGWPDLALSNNAGPARLLLSRGAGSGRWLGLSFAGVEAVWLHARATVVAGSRPLAGRAARDGSYASANDPRVRLALGGHEAGRLRIEWPDGRSRVHVSPPTDRYLRCPAP